VLSFLPKRIGLPLARRLLNKAEYRYYRDALFPLSPIGTRWGLQNHFSSVQYVTVEESVKSKDIYSNDRLPQLFVSSLPLISFVTQFVVLQWIFELVWGHVAYECRK
jgi:hypothetical protein